MCAADSFLPTHRPASPKLSPFALRQERAAQARAYWPRLSLEVTAIAHHWAGRFLNACSRSTPLVLRDSPWQVAGQSQPPGAQLSGASRKGALLGQAGLLHLSWTLLVSPPPLGRRLGKGKERPHPRAHFSAERRLPGGPGPPPAPLAREVSGQQSGSELFLHPEQRSSEATPAPRPVRSPPAPQPPASRSLQRRARGAGAPGRRVSFPQLRRPMSAARGFRGELAGRGPDGAGFPPKPFPPSAAIPLLPRLSLCFAHSGAKGCSPPASNPQPPLPAMSR